MRHSIFDYFLGDFEWYRKQTGGTWYFVCYPDRKGEYAHTYVEWRRSLPDRPHRVGKTKKY